MTPSSDDSRDATALRDRVTGRHPFGEHEGASGASLERAKLDDHTSIVLKTFHADEDLTMAIAGRTVPLEVDLWRLGVLDRLPHPIAHAVLGAWLEGGSWVVAMRDVSLCLLSYESVVDRVAGRRILAAAHAMHQAFAGDPPSDLWRLEQRLCIFAPRVMVPLAGVDNPLPGWTVEGWERFDTIVPADVADAVHAIHEQPSILTQPLLERGGATLLHGDYWMPNLALRPDGVTVIDWALATAGPPIVEFASMLVGCSGQFEASKDEILDELRGMWGARHDERLLQIGLIGGLVELGWNLAWHVAERPDEANQDELQWWVDAARRGLATGLVG